MHTSIQNPRFFIAAAGLLLVATVSGDPPDWWSEGDPPVIDTSATPNNHGPANIGQAKWMAHSAIEALRLNHLGLATEIELALVGEDKIIKTLAPPANDADREKNHAPLLVGQLKNIATPFYDALHIADPIWLEAQLTANRTKDAFDPDNYYPWTLSPVDDQNRAIATIGQLKALFSLRFETLTTAATDNDRDGLSDRWERTHFGNLNASGSEDSDDDGLDNAQEQTLGTNPRSEDSDEDGIMDGVDADPLDEVIDWRKTPEPSWTAWDLSNLNVASDWTLTDLSDNGTMLYIAPDHSIRLVYALQSARTLANAPNSQFYTTSFSGILHGDRIFGRRTIENEDGSAQNEWVFLDPSNNEIVNAGIPQNNPPEHIWDATSLNVSGVGGWNTHEIPSSDGFSGHRFESNENAVAGSNWDLFGFRIVKYWTYANDEYDSGRFIPFPVLSRFTPETHTTATFRQNTPDEDEIIRHIVPSGSGVYVAPPTGGFRESKIKIEKHTLLKPFSATSQGWLIQVDDESVPRVWANGKWHLLKHLVGRNASGEFPESVEPVKISDNGQMVARIRYPDQAGAHYALLAPATASELSPRLVDNEDQIVPGSERPNYLRRDIDGNVLRRLSTTNAMVERDPTPTEPEDQIQDASTSRIAWREVKVKIGNIYEGKTVEWSMTPQFTPSVVTTPATATTAEVLGLHPDGPRFRGSWSTAAQAGHRHRFAPSIAYEDYEFETIPHGNGETGTNEELSGRATTIIEDGYTAIRINLPPIGFNKARISIKIEGSETKLDLLDLEVPAVVVIDPGHGSGGATGGSMDGATGFHTGVFEHDTVFDLAEGTRDEVRKRCNRNQDLLSVRLTRETRINVGMAVRRAEARKNGADVFVSLHFNSMLDTNSTDAEKVTFKHRRHPFGMIDQSNTIANINEEDDWGLAFRVRRATQYAINATQPPASEQILSEENKVTAAQNEANNRRSLPQLHDGEDHNGNRQISPGEIYAPCRSSLIEIEWISNERADILFNGNTYYNNSTGEITLTELAGTMRAIFSATVAQYSINDCMIRNQESSPY